MSAQSKIGIFYNQTDVGNCKNAGFATYNQSQQTYTIGGSGTNMWYGFDDFHYLWTTILFFFFCLPHKRIHWRVFAFSD